MLPIISMRVALLAIANINSMPKNEQLNAKKTIIRHNTAASILTMSYLKGESTKSCLAINHY
jgi:hypothetical protein